MKVSWSRVGSQGRSRWYGCLARNGFGKRKPDPTVVFVVHVGTTIEDSRRPPPRPIKRPRGEREAIPQRLIIARRRREFHEMDELTEE